ncbi:hypothetical protein E4U55_008207 [Claviceps digitariae]|nr:hypothetical protein E4U55_008207 [Claviceps digitariae]
MLRDRYPIPSSASTVSNRHDSNLQKTYDIADIPKPSPEAGLCPVNGAVPELGNLLYVFNTFKQARAMDEAMLQATSRWQKALVE